jgi:hypothetical protein
MRPFKIFIGYDPRETVAFHVLSQSILENSSIPVSITPINLKNLKKFYKRKKKSKDSTEFSISRFLTPYLSDYKGYSLFVDCDFVVRDDIAKLLKIVKSDPKYSCDFICVVSGKYMPINRNYFFRFKLPFRVAS